MMTLWYRSIRWLKRFISRPDPTDILAGVSATPDFPDPQSLISWILLDYRAGVDRAVYFTLEQMETPFVRLTYRDPITINVRYTPPFSPEERMKSIGLSLPAGFSVSHWKRHTHFTLTGPKLSPHAMAEFVDRLFKKLFRPPSPYVLVAWSETHPSSPSLPDDLPPQQAIQQ